MKTTSITEAKNGLSALIDAVRSGESVLILDRGIPVARLDPVTPADDPSGKLRRLERAGIVRVGTAAPPVDLLRTPGPALPPGTSIVDLVLEERESGW